MWLQCQLGLEEMHPQSGKMFVQTNLEVGLGKVSVVLQSPVIENWEDIRKAG